MSKTITRDIFNRKTLTTLIVGLGLYSGGVQAQSAAEVAELRAQIEALSARLAELEQADEVTEERLEVVEASAESAGSGGWFQNVTVSGDLRTRYEQLDDEARANPRDRSRIRARVGIEAEVNDDWTVAVGIATGGDNPISTNQSFNNGGSTKSLGLDYAYFEYSGIENTTIAGGKYKNVFYKAGGYNLIFDGDYRPEGLALSWEASNVFFNAATMFLNSDDRGGSSDKEMAWGLQLGYEADLDSARFIFGGSYYNTSVAGSKPFYDDEDYRNTLAADGTYLNDYENVEVFGDLRTEVADLPFRLYASYVTNQDADEFDTGYAFGAKLGSVSGKGSWDIGYTYQDLEADAVFGGFTDSDFGGGGTDNKGHLIDFGYGLAENTEFGITYFINEYGENANGYATDFDRLHVFVSQKF
jgi:hypothetical protein